MDLTPSPTSVEAQIKRLVPKPPPLHFIQPMTLAASASGGVLQGFRPDVPLAPDGQEDLHYRSIVRDLRHGNEIVAAMLLYGFGG